MKKLNKVQTEIELIAGRVPKLTAKQMDWAKRNFRYKISIFGGGDQDVLCPECRQKVTFPASNGSQEKRCPHCGARIHAWRYFDSRGVQRDNHQEVFFQVMSVVGDWQVTRLIYMERWCYVRKPNTEWRFYECCQAWNKPDDEKTYFRSLPKNCMGYHYNVYALHRWQYECTNFEMETYNKYIECDNVLEARKPCGSNYFDTDNLCPYSQILPAYRKMGIRKETVRATRLETIQLLEAFSGRNYRPMYETLMKGEDYELFSEIVDPRNRDNADIYFSAYRICKRNGYDYKRNFGEWFDLVTMLGKAGLDYRNPHYVCPDDLNGMHQRVLAEAVKRTNDEELWKKLESRKDYQTRIAKYLDMDIHNDDLEVIVLPNVMAFKEEADHLHHCVYRCAYYDKVNSLILSARSRHGRKKRWETIEVSLLTFTILQSYGYADTFTEKHDEIRDLVMENMWQIKERRMGKKIKIAS